MSVETVQGFLRAVATMNDVFEAADVWHTFEFRVVPASVDPAASARLALGVEDARLAEAGAWEETVRECTRRWFFGGDLAELHDRRMSAWPLGNGQHPIDAFVELLRGVFGDRGVRAWRVDAGDRFATAYELLLFEAPPDEYLLTLALDD